MSTSMRWWLAPAMVTAAFLAGQAFSEDPKPAPGKAPEAQAMDPKAMEQLMEQLATPGEQHRWLGQSVGSWNVTGSFLDHDGSRMMVCGHACIRMILGGRWQEMTFQGTMKGKRFEGRGMTGYDNANSRFENTWYDTMSTGTAPAFGQRSEDGKTLHLAGSWKMPGMEMPFRYTVTHVHARRIEWKMFMTMDGKEMEAGQLTYTR